MLKDVGRLCQKPQKLGVGMCRQDMLYKDYTSNPIPTFFASNCCSQYLMACIASKTYQV